MTTYQIVHVKADRSEQLIAETQNPAHIRALVETAEYQGTWLSDTQKLLRFRRGVINVRTVESENVDQSEVAASEEEQDVSARQLEIINQEIVHWKKFEALKLTVGRGGNLRFIMLTPSQIIAYDVSNMPLWTCNSFSELGEMTNKRFAFIVLQIHETYVNTYGYQSAI